MMESENRPLDVVLKADINVRARIMPKWRNILENVSIVF